MVEKERRITWYSYRTRGDREGEERNHVSLQSMLFRLANLYHLHSNNSFWDIVSSNKALLLYTSLFMIQRRIAGALEERRRGKKKGKKS